MVVDGKILQRECVPPGYSDVSDFGAEAGLFIQVVGYLVDGPVLHRGHLKCQSQSNQKKKSRKYNPKNHSESFVQKIPNFRLLFQWVPTIFLY